MATSHISLSRFILAAVAAVAMLMAAPEGLNAQTYYDDGTAYTGNVYYGNAYNGSYNYGPVSGQIQRSYSTVQGQNGYGYQGQVQGQLGYTTQNGYYVQPQISNQLPTQYR